MSGLEWAILDADRLTSVTDAALNVTAYAYDTESNLTGITDAASRTTYFEYDAFGRVTETTFPSTLSETYAYDAVGNLTSKTDRKNQTINYAYDALDRLTQKSYPDSSTVDYVYDLVGKLTQVSDSTGTYQFAYDYMGRLTGTTTDYSFLTTRTFSNAYGYDKNSNRTSFTDPSGGSTTYAYDTLNRLTTLTPPSAITSGNFGFSYDALSRRTQMTRPNGVTTDYTYDNLSRLLSVLHKLSGSTIDGATYTVDAVGNRTQKVNHLASAPTENYTYDSIYQLTQVAQAGPTTTESYSYDAVGNRLSSLAAATWSYNASNHLTSISGSPGTTFTYDNNGNTLTKVDSGGTTTYAWDYENRLTSVTLPSTAVVSFKYDPLGRRIRKVTSSSTTIYAYDGENIVEETDAAGTAQARLAMGLNIDEPLAQLRSGTIHFYSADGLGSITLLTDTAGATAATYRYDTFGNLAASSGSIVNPFRYTAREWDAEIGLYFYRARYYQQREGRFLSEDRLMFDAGPNFYLMALNNPTLLRDPYGLSPDIGQIIAAGIRGWIRVQAAVEQFKSDHATAERVMNDVKRRINAEHPGPQDPPMKNDQRHCTASCELAFATSGARSFALGLGYELEGALVDAKEGRIPFRRGSNASLQDVIANNEGIKCFQKLTSPQDCETCCRRAACQLDFARQPR